MIFHGFPDPHHYDDRHYRLHRCRPLFPHVGPAQAPSQGEGPAGTAKKEHVKVANLHQYDIKPNDGYYKYPIEEKGKLRRFPQHFTAVALELANEQPYSVCLLALAEFDHGELKDTRYFYIRPPENNLSAVKGRYQWDELSKADEFGEYWQAGLKNLIDLSVLLSRRSWGPRLSGEIHQSGRDPL